MSRAFRPLLFRYEFPALTGRAVMSRAIGPLWLNDFSRSFQNQQLGVAESISHAGNVFVFLVYLRG